MPKHIFVDLSLQERSFAIPLADPADYEKSLDRIFEVMDRLNLRSRDYEAQTFYDEEAGFVGEWKYSIWIIEFRFKTLKRELAKTFAIEE